MDCFASRNDGGGNCTHVRDLAARYARVLLYVLPSETSEGAGNAGRSMRPQPRMQNKKAYEHSHHGHTGTPGIPRAMVLTVSFVLFPVTGLCCHRRQQVTTCQLDASIGASEPHDFAVRLTCCSSAAPSVHRIPCPTFVTIAKRPSVWDRMARFIVLIWVR